ncbi:hypothetical protein [Larkinella sp.]|uniref:hypothetical protein n=1 Tax=Larkinella sp. TaxID=2034517 RepID=UPI003BAC9016
MKIWICFLLLVSSVALAQSGEPFKKGNTVYIESLSKNENSQETHKAFVDQLQEWGYWKVTFDKSSADFIIKLNLEASKGITATSWGGTSMACSARFYDKSDALRWETDTYKASPNGTNGFNAKRAAVRKLVNAIEKKYR